MTLTCNIILAMFITQRNLGNRFWKKKIQQDLIERKFNIYLIWLNVIFLLQLCIEYNGLYIYDESQPPPHPIIQHLKAFGVSQVV